MFYCIKFISWNRKWQPTPVFLPAKFHVQRSLVGYSPWGHRVGHDWAPSNTHTHTYKQNAKLSSMWLTFQNDCCLSSCAKFLKTILFYSSCFFLFCKTICLNSSNSSWSIQSVLADQESYTNYYVTLLYN